MGSGDFWKGVLAGCLTSLLLLIGGGVLLFNTAQEMMKEQGAAMFGAPPLPPGPGETVGYDWDITDLDGLPLEPSTLRNHVLVMHVFDTDTALAVLELKSLGELQEDLAGRADVDVTILCVTGDPPEAVRAFAKKQEVTTPLFVFPGGVPAELKAPATDDPRQTARGDTQTLVVEPGGSLAMRYREPASWTADSFRDYLVRLAGGTVAPPAGEGGAPTEDGPGSQDGEPATGNRSGSDRAAEDPTGTDEQPADAPAPAGTAGG